MRDARGDAGLVEEHLDEGEGLVLDEVGMDLLDRDPLLEAAGSVHAGEMHRRHAADADLVDDAVATEEIRSAALRADVRQRATHLLVVAVTAIARVAARNVGRIAALAHVRALGAIVGQAGGPRSFLLGPHPDLSDGDLVGRAGSEIDGGAGAGERETTHDIRPR